MAAFVPAPGPAPVTTHANDPAQGNYFDPQVISLPFWRTLQLLMVFVMNSNRDFEIDLRCMLSMMQRC